MHETCSAERNVQPAQGRRTRPLISPGLLFLFFVLLLNRLADSFGGAPSSLGDLRVLVVYTLNNELEDFDYDNDELTVGGYLGF